MPHQGRKRNRQVIQCNADALKQCVAQLCHSSFFKSIRFANRCSWTPQTLSTASLFWTWSDEAILTDRFAMSRTITKSVWDLPDDLSSAYQPFIRMQQRWSSQLIGALTLGYRQMMLEKLGVPFRQRKRPIFAVDGSRFEVARTLSNEAAFSPRPDNGKRKRRVRRGQFVNPAAEKKSKSPQIWLTLLWHVNSGLPWAWRRGESGSSERHHLLEMLPDLPPRSLLTADAGFAGYDFWKTILKSGHDLLIRVGGNTTLLRKLGTVKEDGSTVYVWPEKAAEGSQSPPALRLIVLNKGNKRVYFVTSILDHTVMSDQVLLGIAQRRWGIEVFYRSWKQTFDKRKLRSRNCVNALIELDWSLIGLWGVCLLAQVRNHDIPPRKLSVAKVLRAVRRPMRSPDTRPERGESLFELLSDARIDDYRRRKPKASRDYPRKKKPDKIGAPIIKPATERQRKAARKIVESLKSAT